MNRILDIAHKDLKQIFRDRKIFLFLLVMPILFTLLFGYAFGGFYKGEADNRLPVAVLDNDGAPLAQTLTEMFNDSEVIRTDVEAKDQAAYEKEVSDGDLAGIIIIPAGYTRALQTGTMPQLTVVTDLSTAAGTTVQEEALRAARRLANAVWTAQTASGSTADTAQFNTVLEEALLAWQEPPITLDVHYAVREESKGGAEMSLAHSSPGMMVQFAIASLLTAATIIVTERKSRALQRLLTTAATRIQILLGHYMAIFIMIFVQFLVLILFGQLLLGLDYFAQPLATLLIAFASALCIAGLGLLIGAFARTEEQAIIFSLIPMFILSGLGGAWVPLEVTGKTFAAVGHVSPVAWAMDGFKNVLVRSQGIETAWLPAVALAGYALLFFAIAVWRLSATEER